MALTFTEKKKIVSEVAAVATEAHSAVAAEYHGLSVGAVSYTHLTLPTILLV